MKGLELVVDAVKTLPGICLSECSIALRIITSQLIQRRLNDEGLNILGSWWHSHSENNELLSRVCETMFVYTLHAEGKYSS